MREMYLRRVKTLADRGLADDGGGTSSLEEQVEAFRLKLQTDAAADRSYWAARGVNLSPLQSGVNEILTTAIPQRKIHFFDTYAAGGAIPLLPTSQSSSATVAFGQIEYQPASGNQDEEFIEIQNPGDAAIDLSNWTLEGGVRHTFQAGTVIAAGQSLYLSPDSAAFRQRGISPTGGESRFVQGNYEGHLSNFGELLAIRDHHGREIISIVSPVDPSDLQLYLAVSEIMYHPLSETDEEFIELLNISDSVTLDLGGVRFTNGIDYLFPSGTTLAPGERVVVTQSQFANQTRLSNGGEALKLEGPGGETIREFRYDDGNRWPVAADGGGASLVLINPEANPDHRLPGRWRLSAAVGGSPGTDDRIFFNGTPSDDLDRDDLSALLEHFHGTTEEEADPAEIKLINGGTSVTLQFKRQVAADDVSFVVQSSKDLHEWVDVVPDLTAVGPYDGTGRQTENLIFFMEKGDRSFFRLRVRLN